MNYNTMFFVEKVSHLSSLENSCTINGVNGLETVLLKMLYRYSTLANQGAVTYKMFISVSTVLFASMQTVKSNTLRWFGLGLDKSTKMELSTFKHSAFVLRRKVREEGSNKHRKICSLAGIYPLYRSVIITYTRMRNNTQSALLNGLWWMTGKSTESLMINLSIDRYVLNITSLCTDSTLHM